MNAAACRRAFIGNDGAARKIMGNDLPGRERIERSVRNIGFHGYADMQRLFRRPDRVGEGFQRDRAILVGMGEIKNFAILGRTPGRLVGIGEEAHRRTRADQDQLLGSFHEFDDLLGEIGNPFDLHAPGAALATRGERVAGDPRAGRRSNTAGGIQSAFLQGGSTDQDHGFPARSERAGGLVDRLGGRDRRHRFRQGGRGAVGLQPRRVGRQDQRRDLSRILQRRLHGERPVCGDSPGARRRMHPTGDRPGKTTNVRRKRRVILRVVRRVVTDDIDDRGPCAARVVEIGEAVRQSWSQMQQGSGRHLRHAAVTIGHPGHGAFEKPEHGPHALDPVEGRYKMHFRGAGIAETDVDARSDKRS